MRDFDASDFLAAVDEIEAELAWRCDTCGTDNLPDGPPVCRVCGEAVLSDGWVP